MSNANVTALSSTRLIASQHDYRSWSVNIPHGTASEELLKPGFWKHHIRTLRPKDTIRAFSEDGTWEMWLTVILPEQSGVRVSKLFFVKHEATEDVADGDYEVKWLGPVLKFGVVRANGDRIKDGLYPKSAAESFLLQLRAKAA